MKAAWPWGVAAVLFLLAFTASGIRTHDWWVAHEAVAGAKIEQLERDIVAANARTAARDLELVSLRRADSVQKAQIAPLREAVKTSAAGWESAKAELRAEAATHAGLVPIAIVEAASAKADQALLDCQGLNAGLEVRITNLEAQVANQSATRVELDQVSVKKDSVLAETVTMLRPPIWKRAFGFVQTHAVAVALGVVGGFVLARR